MKSLLVVLVFVATLTFCASEGYRFNGPNEIFKARLVRQQSPVSTRGWIGANPNGMHAGITENDLAYYPKLFKWLDNVGRR